MRRLIIAILAATCNAWLRSRLRLALRTCLRNRTVYLMEQVDEDARSLRDLRDFEIPRGFRELAKRKAALIEQLSRFSDIEGPTPAPIPDPTPSSCAADGWSPNAPGRVGPLFQQRTRKQ